MGKTLVAVIVCVLRSGGDFRPEHVKWLAKQVPGLVCLSDIDVPGVQTIRLQHDWPGWWSKLEMFGPLLDGDVLMLDLDTVVVQMPAMPKETTVLRDFTRPDIMGSGLMYVTEADRKRIWQAWIADPEGHMAANAVWPKLGDQGFLQEHIGHCQKWQDIAGIYSYKAHCRGGLPSDAQVVCFHGRPRPWNVRADWIPALTETRMAKDFRDLVLAHKGKRICVMGGAETLESDLQGVVADIYISTNGHGVQFRKPDYLLAMDEVHKRAQKPMGAYLRELSDAPIISPHGYADYRLSMWPQSPRFVLSGLVAAWSAWMMGAKAVILAGMNAYGGDHGYMWEAEKMARDIHGAVRVAGGGPLTKTWPAYNPKERFGAYTPHSAIQGWLGMDGRIKVKVLHPTYLGGREVRPGEQHDVMRHEVKRLLKHHMVVEVT